MQQQSPPLSLTRHAAQRLQQRGIKLDTLSLLQQYGRRVYCHNGACRLIFDHDARRQIEHSLGKAAAQFKYSAYAIVDATRGTTVFTAGHRTHRVREYS